jgi:hypothetical protein
MDNTWQIDQDKRQYKMMMEQLERFEEGKIDLGSVIASLETLLTSLQAAEKAWQDAFRSEWWTLEQVYAVALDQQERGVGVDAEAIIGDPENQKLITEAVENMKGLLAEQIVDEDEPYPKKPE